LDKFRAEMKTEIEAAVGEIAKRLEEPPTPNEQRSMD
jgi:hypothetical protein